VRLQLLSLRAVRNLAPLDLEPGPRFNVIAGDNGQGKTNLVEAVYAAVTLRSFRTGSLADLIGFGATGCRIAARVERAGLERIYEVRLTARKGGATRQALIDGKVVRPVARYFGDVNVVLFAPEDLGVPRGSPAERRRFLDRAVFNRRASYLGDAQAYDKVLRSRNALLRRGAAGGGPPVASELLAVYDEQLARLGARVTAARAAFIAELGPRFAAAFAAITQSGLAAELVYQPRLAELVGAGEEASAELLAARLAERRPVDLARGTTTVGPHRDDLGFVLAGHPAAVSASQGQLRALVLAWKTAEMDLIGETTGSPPILLLDDVSSELDDLRNRYLFDFIANRPNQCLITTTHPRHVLVGGDRRDFAVVSGVVSPQKVG
jgi:DNA replication and repair protein RecF